MPTNSRISFGVRLLVWGPLGILALAMAACEFPAGSGCAEEDLTRPFDLSPAHGEVVDSLTPTITWEYLGMCEPDGFEISLGTSYVRTEDDLVATVDARSRSWTPPESLEPHTYYRVRMRAISGSVEGPVGMNHFRTGPVCAVGDPSDYLAPVLTSPADDSVISEAVTYSPSPGEEWTTPLIDFEWEGIPGCMSPGGYDVELSRFATFSPESATIVFWSFDTLGFWDFAPGQEWHDCERYYWRVTPRLGDDAMGPSSETWSFVINTSGVLCPPHLLLITPIPAVIPPGALPIPDTPSAAPFAQVAVDARCRSGPGVMYPIVTYVSQGQIFPIQGRNADSTWWWIVRPDGDCWLADEVVETEGDTSSVPEQGPPPTPTVTPVLGCWQRPNPNLPPRCVLPCPEGEQNPSYCTP